MNSLTEEEISHLKSAYAKRQRKVDTALCKRILKTVRQLERAQELGHHALQKFAKYGSTPGERLEGCMAEIHKIRLNNMLHPTVLLLRNYVLESNQANGMPDWLVEAKIDTTLNLIMQHAWALYLRGHCEISPELTNIHVKIEKEIDVFLISAAIKLLVRPRLDKFCPGKPKCNSALCSAERTLCVGCSTPALATNKHGKCGGCRAARYCSTKCQKKDWKLYHTFECSSLAEVFTQNPTS